MRCTHDLDIRVAWYLPRGVALWQFGGREAIQSSAETGEFLDATLHWSTRRSCESTWSS